MKKLFYLCLLVLTFSCDSDDGDNTIDTSQIVGEWTLDTIDISRVTLDGVDMTELYLMLCCFYYSVRANNTYFIVCKTRL